MLNAKLDKWAELLLDTGKRNNLINFKNRYTSVAEIVHPSSCELFDMVRTLSDQAFEPVVLEDGEKQFPVPGMEDELLKGWYLEQYKHKVTSEKDVLLYSAEQKTLNTIKNIVKKSKVAIEETGVNIAYLAFGFVHWFESEKSEELVAPLLLIPVVFEGRGAKNYPKIDVLENEITVNPSFAYKCEREFGVVLPEYENHSLDEYLNLVTENVLALGWFVTNECKLSTFSFLKINMYRDVEDNRSTILENNNVKVLLGGAPYDHSFLVNSSDELHCIVNADSSQEEAIRAVKSGKSIVLQGPPGTGKSQTITNIIAECLADGKRVLFVSEKLAALNVVYEKLKKEGLSEFCLELHSHKANKKDFLAEICKVLKSEKQVASGRVERELEEKMLLTDNLNEYVRQLHLKREKIQMSVYELISGYFELYNYEKVNYNVKNAKSITEENLNSCVDILEEYVEYTETLGRSYYKSCFYGYVGKDASLSKVRKVNESANKLAKALEQISENKLVVKEKLGVEYDNADQFISLVNLISFLGKSKVMTPVLLTHTYSILNGIGQLEGLATRIKKVKEDLLKVFKPEILNKPAVLENSHSDLLEKYNTITARLLSRRYKSIMQTFKDNWISSEEFNYESAVYYSEKIEAYHNLFILYHRLEATISPALGEAYVGIDSDWVAIEDEINSYISLPLFDKFVQPFSILTKEEFMAKKGVMYSLGENLRSIFKDLVPSLNFLEELYNEDILSFRYIAVEEGKIIAKRLAENTHKLPEWINLLKLLERAKRENVLLYLNAYVESDYDIKDVAKVYRRETYRTLAEIYIAENPILASFTKAYQDRTVARFIEKDEISLEANKALIKSRLARLRPDLAYVEPGSQLAMILHEGAKKRQQKSVRRLLEEASLTIQLVKPCFLMSPLSVSTFLAGGDVFFDVVVFDEASQIFPQDAIGSIYRGKQLVVVGDSKQMPPSNFFINTVTGAIDDENAEDEISDYESILDICSASFAQKYLRWHYRSKHESLIAFSNNKFYGDNLITFPSTETQREGFGVDYYFANGVYEQKQRINRKEAELVADLVFEHFDKRPEKSIGVVAFNMSQQEYIEKVINQRRERLPEYEKFFAEDKKEAFFVKNLETVQGDERDVIVFSIAYAYNSDGKFIHNFGPLNHKGGERRLNVAVTRAKENVKLIASIHSTDIDTERTGAEGAKLLKEYLAFAESGALERSSGITVEELDGFGNEVAQFIIDKGYEIERKLGQSSAKIEIAVKKPSGNGYAVAVECDGGVYAQSQTARDRDRLRKQILEGVGWKYYRVWSLDWFNNRSVAQQKLLKFLKVSLSVENQQFQESGKEQYRNTMSSYSLENLNDLAVDFSNNEIDASMLPEVEEIVDDCVEEELWFESMSDLDSSTDYGFPLYKMANIDDLYARNSANFHNFVKEVLKAEGALNERWFLKRIAYLFGYAVVNSALTDLYNTTMNGCESVGIIRREGFLYLSEQTVFTLRLPSSDVKRPVDCIALEEIANGLLTIINNNGSIEREALYRALARRVGARLNSTVVERFDRALVLIAPYINVDGTILHKR